MFANTPSVVINAMQYCCHSQCKPLLKQDASGQATHIIKNRHAHNDTAANNKLQQTATSSRSSWSGSAVISPTTITDTTITSKSTSITATSASTTANADCANDVVKDEKESIQAVSF
jgi:hypothetical protein